MPKPRRFLRLLTSTRDAGESRWRRCSRIGENSPDFGVGKRVVFEVAISRGGRASYRGRFEARISIAMLSAKFGSRGEVRVRKIIGALLCLIVVPVTMALSGATRARMAPQAANKKQAAWDKLADEYFEQVYFKFAPSNGTSNGLHQYDALLEDYSRTGIDANVAALHGFEKRVEAMDAQGLDETRAADRELVLANIRGTLLTLEVVRPWEKNPDSYSSGVSNSVYVIMIRKFASTDERLRSVVAREEKMPEGFAAARANLKHPPKIYTEIALEQLPAIISFFQNDVPAALASGSDPAVKAAFAKSNGAVLEGLRSYKEWLKSDVLPRS